MNDFNLLNPYIRVAMHSVLPANSVIKQRIIYDYELIYIEKGEFIFNYDGVDYDCSAGQFILIRPAIPHSFTCLSENLYQPHIHFDMIYDLDSKKIPVSFKDIDEFTNEEKKLIRKDIFGDYPRLPFVTFSNKDKVLELFYEISSSKNNGNGLYYKAKLTEIINMLISSNFPDLFCDSAKHEYNVVHQIKDYINAGQGLDMSLGEYEKQFSYSRFYLERQFKKQFGVNIIEYRNKKRMQKACELLKLNSVSAVSGELGFSSIYSFSRTFKTKFGVSPTEYKERYC